MKRLDIITRAGRNLRQAKGRTLLTALAISVGAFTLTLSLAIGAGTRTYFAKFMDSNINKQSLMIARDKSLTQISGGVSMGLKEYDPNAADFGGGATFKTLSIKDIEKIQADKDIKEVIPMYQVMAKYFTFEGVDKKFVPSINVYDRTILNEAAAGSLPKLGVPIADDEIVIPEAYLKPLGIDEKNPQEAIGKRITLNVERQAKDLSQEDVQRILSAEGFEGLANATKVESKDVVFKIRAVSTKPATALAGSDQLSIAESQAKLLSDYISEGTPNHQRYMTAVGIAKDGVDTALVKERLTKMGYPTLTANDLQGMLFTLVNVMQAIVAGFGVLALLASIFGIINTQYISVLERTSQIGLMKALGMSDRAIGRLFRYEAAWIGLLGGVIGALLAVIAGLIFNPKITAQLKLGEGNTLLQFEPVSILLLIVFLVMVGIVAGWLPSRKASRLDPIEALRTE